MDIRFKVSYEQQTIEKDKTGREQVVRISAQFKDTSQQIIGRDSCTGAQETPAIVNHGEPFSLVSPYAVHATAIAASIQLDGASRRQALRS